MSAYIVHPRTIDYLVAWSQRHRTRHESPSVYLSDDLVRAHFESLGHALSGNRLYFGRLGANEVGRLLMAQNVRSVTYRYPNEGADDLPGPNDQTRVWVYTFRPLPVDLLPAWVISCADCLRYQSCETPDWESTLACAVLQGIREEAVRALVGDDAPWGVTDDDFPTPALAVRFFAKGGQS